MPSPQVTLPVATLEDKLLNIIAQLYEIRMSIGDNQGPGFLVNAERNITCFINFQATLPKQASKKIDSKPKKELT